MEQSCVIWHGSLTAENREDLERVQKNALRIILKNEYTHYKEALEDLSLESLEDRRQKLSLRFAIKSKKNPCISELFKPKEKDHNMILRKNKIVKVNVAHTERYKNSAVPYMQRLLNQYEQEQIEKESLKETHFSFILVPC